MTVTWSIGSVINLIPTAKAYQTINRMMMPIMPIFLYKSQIMMSSPIAAKAAAAMKIKLNSLTMKKPGVLFLQTIFSRDAKTRIFRKRKFEANAMLPDLSTPGREK